MERAGIISSANLWVLMMPEDRRRLSPKEFRERYSISPSTLYDLAQQRRVEVLDLGERLKRYRLKECSVS